MSKATRSIAVLMLIGMLTQINSVFLCYGLFLLNQKSIAKNLCEKKTMDCCGHCFLQKKIATDDVDQSASTEKQAPIKTLEELLNTMPGLLPDMLHTPPASTTGHRFASTPASFLLDGVLRQVDHPPLA